MAVDEYAAVATVRVCVCLTAPHFTKVPDDPAELLKSAEQPQLQQADTINPADSTSDAPLSGGGHVYDFEAMIEAELERQAQLT